MHIIFRLLSAICINKVGLSLCRGRSCPVLSHETWQHNKHAHVKCNIEPSLAN